MGAWGAGVFDNDTACDWGYELEECKDLSLIETSIDAVLACGNSDVGARVAERALAAIEVIARLHGNAGVRNSYTEVVDSWVKKMSRVKAPQKLTDKARTAVDRILTRPSEILEVWNDSNLLEQWRSEVLGLKARLVPATNAATADTSNSEKPWWRFW